MSSEAESVESVTEPRPAAVWWPRFVLIGTILLLLVGVPWLTLLGPGTHWPAWVTAIGSLALAAVFVGVPAGMYFGHGRRHIDGAAALGDTLLGVAWVLFTWSVLGQLARIGLVLGGVDDPARSRIVAVGVLAVSATLLAWGYVEAMRVPRVRRLDLTIPRLGPDLDGLRVALITDTHYGPIDRARWSAGVAERVNELDADIVGHVGDIADGVVAQREAQAAPLATIGARLARVYVTGNHEYFSEAQEWLDHMRDLGWDALHNRHIVVRRGADALVIAGVDDATARSSRLAGHGTDLAAALAGADPDLPVLLLAHQPKQVPDAVAAGVDLQVSGHTHGGQIWPFRYLVRLDQPVVHGLSRHGERTQLYTSRGTGFWGPPFRVFAPSEITLLTLRAGG